jgi:hypothetical protein
MSGATPPPPPPSAAGTTPNGEAISPRSRLAALLLCFFLGALGIHRFYVGKIGTGILWLITLGFLGIGALIDFIMIIVGAFRDKEGRPLTRW